MNTLPMISLLILLLAIMGLMRIGGAGTLISEVGEELGNNKLKTAGKGIYGGANVLILIVLLNLIISVITLFLVN